MPTKRTDLPRTVLDAAMRLSAAKGWHATTMSDIAREARIGQADLYRLYPSKHALLAGFVRQIDAEVLAGVPAEVEAEAEAAPAGESPRDRLFDVLMRRLDALRPFKAGLVRVMQELRRDPPAALCLAPHLVRSMAWMLEAAGIPGSGIGGLVRAKALALLWARVLDVWVDDPSEDMSATMAALDQKLKRAEAVVNTACRFAGRSRRHREAAA